MILSDDAERAIARLIERNGLHIDLSMSLPVPIRQVVRDEGWIVFFREQMQPYYGLAIVDGHIRIMHISADIVSVWQRHTMAHELGHVLNGDLGSIHLCSSSPWLKSPKEYRASLAAAKILIPDMALREISSVAEIARHCDVPYDLVELRIGQR